MAVLLLAEHDNKTLAGATAKALSAAKLLGQEVHILVAGSACRAVADAAAKLDGAGKVLLCDAPHLEHQLAEEMAALIVKLMPAYEAALAAATASGKNIMPRVAALLDVMQVSDITKVIAPDTFERPIYAGNAIQTVKSTDAKKVVTVRTAAFPAASSGATSAPIETVAAPPPLALSSFERAELQKSERPELTAARIVVSGGRGLQSAENFKTYLEPLADKLGAALGASRAAVDAGFMPNDCQVGQTGKVVAPELYIAVGISGAIQHLAGMKDSKVIVAINKDGEAPIFQIADYGLVADLFQALPELTAELEKIGHGGAGKTARG
jgi:electron transfer flavoprotein alpha subunit